MPSRWNLRRLQLDSQLCVCPPPPQSHLDALTNPEDGSSELKEIQKVLLYHEQRVYEVIKELPAKMQLGIFDVNTKQVREFISAKHSTTVAALQVTTVPFAVCFHYLCG